MKIKQTTNDNKGGPGFLGLLTLLFIGLKLTGIGIVATWSWWWVLSPIWIPLISVFILMTFAIMIAKISELTR